MVQQAVKSYTANKAVTIRGVAYTKGQAIPMSVIRSLRNIDTLVSNGTIKPDVDPHYRRGSWRRWPTTVHPQLVSGQNLGLTATPAAGRTVSFTVVGYPGGPVNWDFGDGSVIATGVSATTSHMYPAVGTYTAVAYQPDWSASATFTTLATQEDPEQKEPSDG